MRCTLVRIVAAGDVVGGLLLAVAASWFGDHLDLATSTVRIVGIAAVVLGIDLALMATKPIAGRVAMVTEALFALLAVDVLVLREPTGVGVALLVATALYGAAMAVELALLSRTRTAVAA